MSGKNPVMKLPCLYSQQDGSGSSNIGLPAVPKLVLVIASATEHVALGEHGSSNSAADSRTTSESNGVSCVTQALYSSGPPYRMIRSSNQSVAGQPVAVSDSMPMHQGVPPSALICSVSCVELVDGLGAS